MNDSRERASQRAEQETQSGSLSTAPGANRDASGHGTDEQTEQTSYGSEHETDLVETVGDKAERRLAAQHKEERSLWFGLGAFGVIGWSIAIPTLIGVGIGLWLDLSWPSDFSWTLALLLAGVVIGCFNAWYWMNKEQREMEIEKRERIND